jgi:hypothetical protein
VFFDNYNGFKKTIVEHAKTTTVEFILLGFLGILSLTSGYYFKDLFSGFGSHYFNNAIFMIPSFWSFENLEFIPVLIKLAPVVTGVISLGVALLLGAQSSKTSSSFTSKAKTYFETCKWFYNELVNGYVAINGLVSGRHFFEQYEKRLLEYHGPTFIVTLTNFSLR